MVFWTLRLCIPLLLSWDFGVRPCMRTATSSGTFGSHPHSHSVEHLLEHLHPLLFSLFCLSCFVTPGCFVNSSCLLLTLLCCSRVLGSLPWLFVHGFSGPNPWLFYFLHGHLSRVSSIKSNDFNANFSFGIIAAVQSIETSSISTSRASITHRPLVTIEVAIFNVQLESSITLSMY